MRVIYLQKDKSTNVAIYLNQASIRLRSTIGTDFIKHQLSWEHNFREQKIDNSLNWGTNTKV